MALISSFSEELLWMQECWSCWTSSFEKSAVAVRDAQAALDAATPGDEQHKQLQEALGRCKRGLRQQTQALDSARNSVVRQAEEMLRGLVMADVFLCRD
jgi:hypothetical protein